MRSTSHIVTKRSGVSSGGSGDPVSTSAGVASVGIVVSTGGGVSESATAAPEAMPMKSTSTATRVQKRAATAVSRMPAISRLR